MDAAIIAVQYRGELCRIEITTLNLQDNDRDIGKMIVRGKRQKDGTAYLQNGPGKALNDWLNKRGDENGAIYLPVTKIAGHENVDTNAHYGRWAENVKRKAAGLLHLPYNGRKSTD